VCSTRWLDTDLVNRAGGVKIERDDSFGSLMVNRRFVTLYHFVKGGLGLRVTPAGGHGSKGPPSVRKKPEGPAPRGGVLDVRYKSRNEIIGEAQGKWIWPKNKEVTRTVQGGVGSGGGKCLWLLVEGGLGKTLAVLVRGSAGRGPLGGSFKSRGTISREERPGGGYQAGNQRTKFLVAKTS